MENTNPQTPIVPQFRIDEQIMKANYEFNRSTETIVYL